MTTTRDTEYVAVTDEDTEMRAHWIAGALETHGIPTFVDEHSLMDEFAMSQKAMGLLRHRVMVPADRLEEARTVFLALSQPIPSVEEDDTPPARSPWPPKWVKRVALFWVVLAAITFVAMLIHQLTDGAS